ncbi:hypothetical protein BU25DRAFT_195232 [Macroventuria anomochaeta]|uniref:Uncharacterized protein n=1 Tax=Macroventuria anomochaeta TaxID=301207 RepID=A0ACB6SED9_9PLEO|nr:uncharacterized protein BU25DRAFT_195232 [Macroventuria anomochaeta]KAF2631703.1 hypothetical protein BU25DRAFT_195232 [Macroventuria anomochaeta]
MSEQPRLQLVHSAPASNFSLDSLASALLTLSSPALAATSQPASSAFVPTPHQPQLLPPLNHDKRLTLFLLPFLYDVFLHLGPTAGLFKACDVHSQSAMINL